jgi:hypothetical protein
MMLHVFDHFDFTNDIAWWQTQGYPLLKGVAQFDIDRLTSDLHFNDSTLVVPVCNSPEQPIITFGESLISLGKKTSEKLGGCSHQQQLVWQLLNAVEKGFDASGDKDTDFLKCEYFNSFDRPAIIRINSRPNRQSQNRSRDSRRLVGPTPRCVPDHTLVK